MRVAEYAAMPIAEVRERFEALRKTFPRPPVHMLDNENTDHGNYFYYNKDSYYLFDATRNEGCGYVFDSHRNKKSFDVSYVVDSELCYDCLDCDSSYGCFGGQLLVKCKQCLFSRYLVNCAQCIGCVNLKSQKYCILNKQYTSEEYKKEVQEILSSFDLTVLVK